MDKKTARLQRGRRTRIKLRCLNHIRLSVYRTSKHMYAQIISGDGSRVLASASTLEKEVREKCAYTGNVSAAKVVGEFIARRALEENIESVAFDRSGFKYHGRIEALANAAREHGLKF